MFENIVLGITGFLVIFLPAFAANHKKHSAVNVIFILNILAFCVLLVAPVIACIFWLALVIWAFSKT